MSKVSVIKKITEIQCESEEEAQDKVNAFRPMMEVNQDIYKSGFKVFLVDFNESDVSYAPSIVTEDQIKKINNSPIWTKPDPKLLWPK